jgi:hypothetical protein
MRQSIATTTLWGLAIVLSVAAAPSLAQSAKATAAINTAVGCTVSNATTLGTAPMSCHDVFSGAAVPVTPDNFATVMSSPMKVSNSQSLFVSPSLVTGLYTSTTTKTRTGSTSTATAEGGVFMRAVLTDFNGNIVRIADPVSICTNDILGCHASASGVYGVVLDQRVQTLTQSISQCVVSVVVGGVTGSGTCTFDVTTQLILDTTSAHTFNFIFPDVGVGTYMVAIQVAVDSNAVVSGSGTAVGAAAFGLGSVTIESVRLVHDFSF